MVFLLWRKPNSSSHCHSHILHRKIASFGLIQPTVSTPVNPGTDFSSRKPVLTIRTYTLKLNKLCGATFGPYKSQTRLKIFYGEQPENHYQQNKICRDEPSQIALYVINANLNLRQLYMRHGRAGNWMLFGRMMVYGVSEGQVAF